ncbi:MAG: DUF1611 domain-containing protein [Planctomycetota bacterium]
MERDETTLNELESHRQKLASYRRIVLLTEGFSDPFYAKTAISLLRYRGPEVIAILDSGIAAQSSRELFGVGDVPVVASLDGLHADAVFLGTATVGGKLPSSWKKILLDALSRGLDVVSGTHEFLIDDPDFRQLAQANGCRLIDVRRNAEYSTSTGEPFRAECLRIHTVGQDCSLGKMVVALELQRALMRRGEDAHFVATGQTGIMISGDGIPVDCVVADFVNGSVEALVRRHEHHDILVIEGQGSISHPSFSAVTMGLLHGCAPQALIYCYEVGRTNVKGLDTVWLHPHRKMMDAYVTNASLRSPAEIIGIAMNGRNASPEEIKAERDRMTAAFHLPVCDVYRDGPDTLVDAVMRRRDRSLS